MENVGRMEEEEEVVEEKEEKGGKSGWGIGLKRSLETRIYDYLSLESLNPLRITSRGMLLSTSLHLSLTTRVEVDFRNSSFQLVRYTRSLRHLSWIHLSSDTRSSDRTVALSFLVYVICRNAHTLTHVDTQCEPELLLSLANCSYLQHIQLSSEHLSLHHAALVALRSRCRLLCVEHKT